MNNTRKSMCFFTLILALPACSYGHSFAKYASTPITPPAEFIWWFPISVAILLCTEVLLIHRLFSYSWKKSSLLSLIIVATFAITFFLFGNFSASTTTGPPPGLGLPHPVFWGFGWTEVGTVFIKWNVLGILFLICSSFLFTKAWKHKVKLKLICTIITAYIICLIPYLSSEALVHGWAGGYVHNGCRDRIEILTEALIKYGKNNERKFPEAESFDELMEKLSPYIEYERLLYKNIPLDTCPLGWAYEKVPESYTWNKKFSDKSIADFSYEDISNDISPIKCIYHKGYSSSQAIFMLLEYMELEGID